MAGDIAPGLGREYYGFLGWKQHQPDVWKTVYREAEQRCAEGEAAIPDIIGYDSDPEAVAIAIENIERANMRGKIHVEKRELSEFTPKTNATTGLVVTNPPYGERLGEEEELQPLYTLLGERLKEGFTGWHAAVLTGNPDLGKQMGLRANNYYALFNGPIPCKLLLFAVQPEYFVARGPEADNERRIRAAQRAVAGTDLSALQMFINRLRKNYRHIKKQAEKKGETTYRIYDTDLPEYAFAIDIDGDKVIVQEYQPPKTVEKKKAIRRQQEVLSVLPEELEVEPAQIFFTIAAKNKK
jgi:23S rRNA (guanine2445-N2)-methyltransferase / 23S rRNA (guanine2069-N7)-methyltransferase